MELPELTVDCIGIHLGRPLEGHSRIEWGRVTKRNDWVRVRAYTCSCQPLSYEFCQAGGSYFIRRFLRRGDGSLRISESPHDIKSVVENLWGSLLRGQAL